MQTSPAKTLTVQRAYSSGIQSSITLQEQGIARYSKATLKAKCFPGWLGPGSEVFPLISKRPARTHNALYQVLSKINVCKKNIYFSYFDSFKHFN